jgi:hypothetical protein
MVTRWRDDTYGDVTGPQFEMVQHPKGDYVLFEDYEKLTREVERLTRHLTTANNNHEHFERLYYLEMQKNEAGDAK